jgi:predicted AAA+ superfamily ATPase
MVIKDYYPRIVDKLLDLQLEASGAVLIEGAKWIGKTYTGRAKANSVLFMQDTDNAASYIKMAQTQPSLLLRGETPRLLDEWQEAPVLWDAVRFAVDQRGEMGQFILTGSAVPKDGETMHTGTGRIARVLMRPMSLYESKESSGEVSLKALFDGAQTVGGFNTITIEKMSFILCRGGWPAAVKQTNERAALQTARNYVMEVSEQDIQRVDGTEKNPNRVRLVLRSLARNISTMANLQTIKADIEANDNFVSDKTVAGYINALRRIFVVEDIPAWQPSLRSKTAVRTSCKRQFVDPSIGLAILRVNPGSLLNDLNTFGFFFESLCTRDMRVYATANDGEVYHYKDKSGLESDMIIRLYDGRWAAVEVKLGSKEIEEAAKHLLELKAKIDTNKVGEPSFLMILTGGQHAYRREDGVFVVPIGCMKD